MTQERMRKIEAEAPAAAARGDWESVAHLISDSAARRPPQRRRSCAHTKAYLPAEASRTFPKLPETSRNFPERSARVLVRESGAAPLAAAASRQARTLKP
jgi:hypothetical protein